MSNHASYMEQLGRTGGDGRGVIRGYNDDEIESADRMETWKMIYDATLGRLVNFLRRKPSKLDKAAEDGWRHMDSAAPLRRKD